ncbi:MAG: hypothetical protein FGM43_01330 [Sinobacteraceae bacterium]|nr:hypothetical protein [Nevskiaceae bacterium]
MSTRYYSAIDSWLVFVMGVAMLVSLYACWTLMNGGWPLLLLALPVGMLGIALPLWVLLDTHYTLSPTSLDVRCGPFKTRIALDQIREVSEVRSLLSSSALSIDRLEITYNLYQSIMISPRDRRQFFGELESLRARLR